MDIKKVNLIVENINLPIDSTDGDAVNEAEKKVSRYKFLGKVEGAEIYKKSVDARKKSDIKLVYSVCLSVNAHENADYDSLKKSGIKLQKDETPKFTCGTDKMNYRPVVIGFGPAGMFASLYLAKYGYKPIVLERGDCVDRRVKAVRRFEEDGILDTETNIQFGAGGAGTFSDGKLTTRINDPYVHAVLKELYGMGAPKDVLTRAKPHIGTDILRNVVKSFHDEITRLGGEIRYLTKVLNVFEGGVETEDGVIASDAVIVATGHSARDFYRTLINNDFSVECKPFSVGVRIEHLQYDIDFAMYGNCSLSEKLGHAEYALSLRNGKRGVYTFCMCPGGKVVAAASEEGGVVTNGMSTRARDGLNSNAALAVSVIPEDFGSDPLRAIEFQRKLEMKAFESAGSNYSAPAQLLKGFYEEKTCDITGKIIPSYRNGKVTPCDFNSILPHFVSSMLKDGIREFGRKIKGFDDPTVPITGVETRTSAPLRILRNCEYEAIGKKGIYPCGEGAGYAGGIVSAAVDGIRVAGAIIEKFAPISKL